MKKILFIIIFLLNITAQAQKAFQIINLTANVITIDDLVTNIGTYNSYPEFHSKLDINGVISVQPYSTYKLQTTNLTRFPFFSPTSTPPINNWTRQATATSTISIISSTVAFPLGAAQVFYWVQLRVGGNSKNIGAYNSPVAVTSLTSNGWTAIYSNTGTLTAPIYTITIM